MFITKTETYICQFKFYYQNFCNKMVFLGCVALHNITVTSTVTSFINHWQIDCLFNNLFRLATKESLILTILAGILTSPFPSKKGPVCGKHLHIISSFRDHFLYMPNHWELVLQCNVVSHWPDAFTKWSLIITTWIIDKSNKTYFSNPKWCSYQIGIVPFYSGEIESIWIFHRHLFWWMLVQNFLLVEGLKPHKCIIGPLTAGDSYLRPQ